MVCLRTEPWFSNLVSFWNVNRSVKVLSCVATWPKLLSVLYGRRACLSLICQTSVGTLTFLFPSFINYFSSEQYVHVGSTLQQLLIACDLIQHGRLSASASISFPDGAAFLFSSIQHGHPSHLASCALAMFFLLPVKLLSLGCLATFLFLSKMAAVPVYHLIFLFTVCGLPTSMTRPLDEEEGHDGPSFLTRPLCPRLS